MLAKRVRLTTAEVSEVLARGQSVRGGLLSMKFITHTGPGRAAVVAPKSLARKATQRNRLRRAVYSALSTLPTTSSMRGIQAVFFVRNTPPSPMVSILRHELELMLKKISSHV